MTRKTWSRGITPPFPSAATPPALDHNFAVHVEGSIQIASAGTYTFDVTSGDGFQLSIGTQTFTGSSSGTTYGSTMTYSSTRTTADSLGVTTFAAAGTYPIDLYYFDGATDAPRLELSAAAGSYTSFNSSSFHLIGDTTDGGLGVVGVNSLVGTNLQSAMLGTNATALVRIPFSVDASSECTQLTLSMEYDDGFVAYLNGVQVASANAPTTPAWNSTATAVNGPGDATRYQTFNLANDEGDLVGGANMLAIQGLNISSSDPDFLVLPQLQYSAFNLDNIEYFTTPTPGTANVAGNLGTVKNTSFSVSDGFYTAPFYTSITCPTAGATILYTLDGRTPVVPTFGTAETISSITYSGTTATVTTAAAHGYYTGDQVRIAGATPTQYDGVFNISVSGTNTFTYTMASAPTSNAAGTMTAVLIPVSTVNSRTISAITYSGTTATATCTAHGYSSGETVQITGASPWQYDGIFIITAVNANTFTYTMSSSPGTSASGTITAAAVSTMTYTGPIYISTTTTLRTEAIEVGYFTSYLDTATYIFMNAVINTPQIFTDDPTNAFYALNQEYVTNPNFNANNYPQMWTGIDSTDTDPHGGSPTTVGQSDDLYSADYGMDPQVVDDPDYASTIISDLQSIPTLSLVMNPDDWFGEGTSGTNGIKGIMVNSAQQDANGTVSPLWKREASVELINPDGSVGFQINAGIKMHGGGSDAPTKEPEHSFTLEFDSSFGGTLDYPFFGPTGASSYQ